MKSIARLAIISSFFFFVPAQGMFMGLFGGDDVEEPQQEISILADQLHVPELIDFMESPPVGLSYLFLCDLVEHNPEMMSGHITAAIPLGRVAKGFGLVNIMVNGIVGSRQKVCAIFEHAMGERERGQEMSVFEMLFHEVGVEESVEPATLGAFFARFCTKNALRCLGDHKDGVVAAITDQMLRKETSEEGEEQRLSWFQKQKQGVVSFAASALINHCTTRGNRERWEDNFGSMGANLEQMLAVRRERMLAEEEEQESEGEEEEQESEGEEEENERD
ncbi:hypothetical protein ACFLX2_00670 [Candidatus Dependentiae bacterium]